MRVVVVVVGGGGGGGGGVKTKIHCMNITKL